MTALDLDVLVLKPGSHAPDGEYCVMEAVAALAGEPWSDAPACVCPVIGGLLRAWNDGIHSDAERTRLLKPLIQPAIGTRSTPEVERMRSSLALDWLVRVNLPAWCDLVPTLASHAAALRALPETTDWGSCHIAVIAAGAAARDAARDAAGAAAGAPAWAAAWAAGRAAAGAASGAAALAAAGAAAGAAAWAAAGTVAVEVLQRTVELLQSSAQDLVLRMCAIRDGEQQADRSQEQLAKESQP